MSFLDRRSVRFGFREFWIEGPHFLLNGHKVRLMGESGVWPKWDPRPGEDTPRPGRPWSRHESARCGGALRAYKAMNMTAVRLHYRVGNRVEIEVADELGLLVIPQSGLWTAAEPYERGGSPLFQQPGKRSLKSGSATIVTAPPWSFGMWKTRSCAGERPPAKALGASRLEEMAAASTTRARVHPPLRAAGSLATTPRSTPLHGGKLRRGLSGVEKSSRISQ